MEYLDYCLTTKTIELHQELKIQVPVLSQIMISRPEINKILVIESVNGLQGKYKEVKKIVTGDKISIDKIIREAIQDLGKVEKKLEESKEEALKKFYDSTKEDIIEKEIEHIKAKINNLDATIPEELDKIQVYVNQIRQQEKGLRRENKRTKNRNYNITKNYDYDITIIKQEIYTLNNYLEFIRRNTNLNSYY